MSLVLRKGESLHKRPGQMTQRELAIWLQTFRTLSNKGVERACEYGHFGCSIREGGLCENHVAGLYEGEDY